MLDCCCVLEPLAIIRCSKRCSSESKNVELVKFVPNMADFYGRCDVFVLPSVDDGFGMALVEAMAHGLRVHYDHEHRRIRTANACPGCADCRTGQ